MIWIILAYLVMAVICCIQPWNATLQQYGWNHLWAFDRWLNVVFCGSSKEFISTRVFNYRFDNLIAWWCYGILNGIDPGHCERAAKRDYDPDHSSDALLK